MAGFTPPCTTVSRTGWTIWGLSIGIGMQGAALCGTPHATGVMLFASAWFTWTWAEYYLHRWVMHDPHGRTDPATHREHYRHHRRPHDLHVKGWHRAIVCGLVPGLLYAAWYWRCNTLYFAAGSAHGLASYAVTHWLLHRPVGRWLIPGLVRFHEHHHCIDPGSCYGVTVRWWDMLLDTAPRSSRPIAPRIQQFYRGAR